MDQRVAEKPVMVGSRSAGVAFLLAPEFVTAYQEGGDRADPLNHPPKMREVAMGEIATERRSSRVQPAIAVQPRTYSQRQEARQARRERVSA